MQTEVLYTPPSIWRRCTGGERAIDAYCGTGTIGLVAAAAARREVIGVDSVESAIRDARQNARHNGVDNARFVAADAGAFMRQAAQPRRSVGPQGRRSCCSWIRRAPVPREEFIAPLAELAPERIVYISCNPETQVRDLGFLKQFCYGVRTVQPVDMFPHTDHIETIALIERM